MAAPPASSPAVRRSMQSNRRKDTGPELLLRRELHRLGLRYRVDFPVRVPGGKPVRPDVVFTRAKVAVFVDGCFWHGCPEHFQAPAANVDYWQPKIAATRGRDRSADERLRSAGWTVLRTWEHEPPVEAAERILRALAARNPGPAATRVARTGRRTFHQV